MFRKILLLTSLSFAALTSYGQVVTECPQNVGFENNTFSNWECYSGDISQTRATDPSLVRPAFITVMPSGPAGGRHTLIKKGSGQDSYGKFSTDAPNGSAYVVQLGNNINGRGAERLSYTINVPSDVETYSIIFNYAVVFENPFNHDEDEQPAFTAKVIDVTANSSTSCGSFQFVAPGLNGGIPGFAVSQLSGGNNSNVLYKPWSPVLVNLTDYRGHVIRLEFTTNDCSRGGHFGYSYIDFNENCSIPITGNVTCPGAENITLRTLSGFFQYSWYNTETRELLGTADSLIISPAPPVGTKISVELVPYAGLGCTLTLYTSIVSMDMHIKTPLTNCVTHGVDLTDISIKVGNSSDLTYNYWKDPQAKIRIPDPKKITVSGRYYVKGTASSGCFMILPVDVVITDVPAIVVSPPPPVNYPHTVDITKTFVHDPSLTYSYWVKPDTSIRLKDPLFIRRSGTFYIKGSGLGGCECFAAVNVEVTIVDMEIPNAFTPNGDGINDVFTILIPSKINIKSFRIRNRWGETVFVTSDITHYWDGFKENTRMPVGVYYWVMEGDDNAQKKFLKSGYVTVIR